MGKGRAFLQPHSVMAHVQAAGPQLLELLSPLAWQRQPAGASGLSTPLPQGLSLLMRTVHYNI